MNNELIIGHINTIVPKILNTINYNTFLWNYSTIA